jgi:hypothetical protein
VVKRTHRTYSHKGIDTVLDFLINDVIPRNSISEIELETGIPHQTLSRWRHNRQLPGGENWYPQAGGHPNKRTFSPEVEASINEFIHTNFIDVGNGATCSTLKVVTTNAFISQSLDENFTERFCCSRHFMANFMQRNDLSLRQPHDARRPSASRDDVEEYHRSLERIESDYPKDKIYNCDETSWQINMYPSRVLADIGAEAVTVYRVSSDKERLTAMATITADGSKLDMWIIAKGVTPKSLKKLGNHSNVQLAYTENGWTTEEFMKTYLMWLHQQANELPCCLILDVYASHITPLVKSTAIELDIELLFVPPGCTAILQPLDYRIFGELKARARCEHLRYQTIEGMTTARYEDAIKILGKCWSLIPNEHILKAWKLK